MEMRDIEYFVAIAEHGNMRRAAESLGITQPALTKCARRLESEFSAKLIKRTPKGIELTAVGAAFHSRIRRLRLSLDDISKEVADLAQGRAGHLRIGVAPAASNLLQAACRSLFESTQNVTMAVTIGSNDVLVPALRKGTLDLIVSGIPAHPSPELVHEILFEDKFVVISAATHPLTERKKVRIADLVGYRWVLATPMSWSRRWIERAFQDYGFAPPRIVLETGSIDLTMSTVASTDLLGFHAGWIVRMAQPRFRVREVPVKELEWRRRMGISYRLDAYLPPAAVRFMEMLKTAANRN